MKKLLIIFSAATIISFLVLLFTSGEFGTSLFMSLIIGVGVCIAVVDGTIEGEAAKGKQSMISCNKCGHIAPGVAFCPKCGSCFVRRFYI